MQRTPDLEEQIRRQLRSLVDVVTFCNLWRAVAGENVEPPPLDGTLEGKLAREAMWKYRAVAVGIVMRAAFGDDMTTDKIIQLAKLLHAADPAALQPIDQGKIAELKPQAVLLVPPEIACCGVALVAEPANKNTADRKRKSKLEYCSTTHI